MSLTIMQILAGMCRPDANAGKKRTVFNWVHRICGLLTYLLAVATMFIGNNIDYMSETMKTLGNGLMAGSIVVPFLVLVILQAMDRPSSGKSTLGNINC